MQAYLRSMRAHQYVKNLFIFAPAFFSLTLLENLAALVGVFCGFCLLCSGVYVFNDILDRNADRAHPVKKFRPIASGEIRIKHAAIFSALLGFCGVIFILLSFMKWGGNRCISIPRIKAAN